ncbi:hypothetical protein pb186bvf_013541 [Paramecium bursaria]
MLTRSFIEKNSCCKHKDCDKCKSLRIKQFKPPKIESPNQCLSIQLDNYHEIYYHEIFIIYLYLKCSNYQLLCLSSFGRTYIYNLEPISILRSDQLNNFLQLQAQIYMLKPFKGRNYSRHDDKILFRQLIEQY